MVQLSQRIEELASLLGILQDANMQPALDRAVDTIANCLVLGKPLLLCGNGGSASDALHISGELVGRFLVDRKALNVVCLNSNVSILTAWSNDFEYESVFSRQVEAHGSEGAVILGISTSGNSRNVVSAFKTAKIMGMHTIALTGTGGGRLADYTDILIDVPSSLTPRVQELHLPIYHYLCEAIERRI